MITRYLKSGLLAAIVVATSLASQVRAEIPSTLDLVPAYSGALVHVNVEQLLASEQLELATDLVNRVDVELADVFRKQVGVNALRLRDVSIVVPPLEIAFAENRNEPAYVGFFAFSEAYDSAQLLQGIGGNWNEVKGENSLYYRNEEGLSVLLLSDHTFLCGTQEGMEWWIGTLSETNDSEPLVNAIANARNGATVTVALNTADLPAELLTDLPLPLRPFADSSAVIVNAYIDESTEFFVAVDYDDAPEAARAERNLRSLIDLGRTFLRQYEQEYSEASTNNAGSFDDRLSAVGMLALVRHADAHLQNIRISRDDYQLQADLVIDTPAPMLIVGAMTAIAAIGNQANEEFADVASQLGQTAN